MPERIVAIIVTSIIGALGTLTLFIPADRLVVSGLLMATFGLGSIAMAVWMIIRTKPEQWIPTIAWGVALMLFFFIVGAGLEWFPDSAFDVEYQPGLDKDPPEYIFCEGYLDGWIMQPISVWTDLAFVLSGVALMLIASLRSGSAGGVTSDPPILRTCTLVPLAYSFVVVYMGPGSMYYHASMRDWCGWCDWFSIVNWAAFGLGYTMWRMLRQVVGDVSWPLWVIWGVVAIPIAAAGAAEADSREILRMLTIVVWVTSETFVMAVLLGAHFGWWKNFLKITRNGWTFGACILAFAAAFGCWIPSGGTDLREWCDPDSAMQGHGFWHIFAAAGTFTVFLHWASERRK